MAPNFNDVPPLDFNAPEQDVHKVERIEQPAGEASAQTSEQPPAEETPQEPVAAKSPVRKPRQRSNDFNLDDVLAEARQQFPGAGLVAPADLIADGQWHRCAAAGGRQPNDAGSYKIYGDGWPTLILCNWREGGEQIVWHPNQPPGRKLSKADRAEADRRNAERKAEAEREIAEGQARVAAETALILEGARTRAVADTPYTVRKDIEPCGAICDCSGDLYVPMHGDDGKLWNRQTISPDGDKDYPFGGRVKGCCFTIGEPVDGGIVVIAEGFATGASVHRATGLAVIIAFTAGNLKIVAELVRARLPSARIVIGADDDAETEVKTGTNTGIVKAHAAAAAVGGIVIVAQFGPDRGPKDTDFNDVHVRYGLDAVRQQIEAALAAAKPEGGAEPGGSTKTDEQPKKITINTKAPFDNAKSLLRRNYTEAEHRTLHRHRASFYQWAEGAYRAVTDEDIRARLYEHLAKCWEYDKELNLDLVSPDQKMVTEHADALRAAAYLNDTIEAPAWIGEQPPDMPAEEILSLENGLLHLPSKSLLKHTAAFFTYNALPFDYQPGAPDPVEWLKFLNQLWPDDPASIQTLREIFGLCLTKDTKFQKMFLILGPKRCGKGTIGRILRAMLGTANVCSPTLGSLSGEFGLQSLIGKLVAIISDARLTAKTDSDAVAERLLNISGEDAIDVNRKNTTFWHGQLMVRVIMLANGLPRFNDSSGAFAGRFIVLRIVPSFYGKEDLGLTKKLMAELPGILNWSIGGWESVTERGYFEQPDSGSNDVRAMEDMASPVSVFVRERCVIDGGLNVAKKALYRVYCDWCEGQGRQPGNILTFGKNLKEVLPGLGEFRPQAKPGETERPEHWKGIALKEDAPRAAGDPNDPRGPWWQKD